MMCLMMCPGSQWQLEIVSSEGIEVMYFDHVCVAVGQNGTPSRPKYDMIFFLSVL